MTTQTLGTARLVSMPGSADKVPRDGAAFCALVARAAVEISLGVRSHAQLARWVSEEVFIILARLAGQAPARPTRTGVRVRTVRAQRLGDSLEGAVVLDDGVRVRTVAVAASWQRGRWLATDLYMP